MDLEALEFWASNLMTKVFFRFQIEKFMFLIKKGFLPDAFKELFLLTSHIHRYYTRHCNSVYLFPRRMKIRQFAKKRFRGPKLFNSFNSEIQNVESISLFKSKLKSFVLNGLLLF